MGSFCVWPMVVPLTLCPIPSQDSVSWKVYTGQATRSNDLPTQPWA